MIICPSCKEEIEDDSRYCDQCGQELVYCSSCGRVGIGRRCTYCGGLMISAEEKFSGGSSQEQAMSAPTSPSLFQQTSRRPESSQSPLQNGVPTLTL